MGNFKYVSIFILGVVCVFGISCCYPEDHDIFKYNPNAIISGYVTDIFTGDPIDNAEVSLVLTDTYNYWDTSIVNYYSDSNGYFETEKCFFYFGCWIEVSKTPGYKTIAYSDGDLYNTMVNSAITNSLLDVKLEPIIYSFQIIPDSIVFEMNSTVQEIVIMNAGTGNIYWSIESNDADFLQLNKSYGTIEQENFEILSLTVSRTNLSPGVHMGTVVITTTNAGNLTLSIQLKV